MGPLPSRLPSDCPASFPQFLDVIGEPIEQAALLLATQAQHRGVVGNDSRQVGGDQRKMDRETCFVASDAAEKRASTPGMSPSLARYSSVIRMRVDTVSATSSTTSRWCHLILGVDESWR